MSKNHQITVFLPAVEIKTQGVVNLFFIEIGFSPLQGLVKAVPSPHGKSSFSLIAAAAAAVEDVASPLSSPFRRRRSLMCDIIIAAVEKKGKRDVSAPLCAPLSHLSARSFPAADNKRGFFSLREIILLADPRPFFLPVSPASFLRRGKKMGCHFGGISRGKGDKGNSDAFFLLFRRPEEGKGEQREVFPLLHTPLFPQSSSSSSDPGNWKTP